MATFPLRPFPTHRSNAASLAPYVKLARPRGFIVYSRELRSAHDAVRMKKLLIFIVLSAICTVAFNRWQQYRAVHDADKNMVRVVAEMNGKLPMDDGVMRVEKVEYAARVLRYSGTLLKAEDMTAAWKTSMRGRLQERYCGSKVFRTAKVSVAYEIAKAGPRTLSEKVNPETWTTTVGPDDCT